MMNERGKPDNESVSNCHLNSGLLRQEKATRRRTMCILSDFHTNIILSGGLLNEYELMVGDEDIVVPVGGKSPSLASISGNDIEGQIIINPEIDHNFFLQALPNPEFESRGGNGDQVDQQTDTESVDEPLHLIKRNKSPKNDKLVHHFRTELLKSYPASRKNADEEKKWLANLGSVKTSKIFGSYSAKPSRLRQPTMKYDFFRSRTSPEGRGKEDISIKPVREIVGNPIQDSPMSARLRYLEANPELAFSGSYMISNSSSDAEKESVPKKNSLEKHYELWGTSQLPGLDERKF